MVSKRGKMIMTKGKELLEGNIADIQSSYSTGKWKPFRECKEVSHSLITT